MSDFLNPGGRQRYVFNFPPISIDRAAVERSAALMTKIARDIQAVRVATVIEVANRLAEVVGQAGGRDVWLLPEETECKADPEAGFVVTTNLRYAIGAKPTPDAVKYCGTQTMTGEEVKG